MLLIKDSNLTWLSDNIVRNLITSYKQEHSLDTLKVLSDRVEELGFDTLAQMFRTYNGKLKSIKYVYPRIKWQYCGPFVDKDRYKKFCGMLFQHTISYNSDLIDYLETKEFLIICSSLAIDYGGIKKIFRHY